MGSMGIALLCNPLQLISLFQLTRGAETFAILRQLSWSSLSGSVYVHYVCDL